MRILVILLLSFLFIQCTPKAQADKSASQTEFYKNLPDTLKPVVKSEAEWRKELSDKEFYVLREKGTERSFTGEYWDNKKEGMYLCRACQLPLFESDTKYKSGTGWPSFWEPLADAYIYEETDYKIGYPRTEVMCARCGSHLGHVFNDGPEPTGLRYCINSVSLEFEEGKNDHSGHDHADHK